nr:MAG TPA: tail fiber protein [Caudoviricetes sp.]
MAETKFLDSAGLTHLLEKTNAKFSKLGHTHTKAEITDFAHTHDDRYYTETEIDSKLSGKSNTGHTHDDRYYTESEMNTKLAGKSDTSHSHSTHLTTEIAAGADLNTVTTAGWYKCPASATAAGLKNCPTKIAFAMEVLLNAGVTQKVYEYDSSVPKVYIRNFYDSAWGEWKRIYTTADKPTAGEIGAAASSHTHTKAQISDFPTSMPASDVYAWAKAPTKPSYSKGEVGLGNVDNTADSAKSVKYATSAGSAGAVAWANVSGKPTTFAPSAHNHDDLYYQKSKVDGLLSGKAAASHKHGAADITSVNASAITGTIAAANLPSFVDDVLEGYYGSDGVFYKNHDASTGKYSDAYTGETGKIYVNLNDNKTYRWSGSAYVVISETIALGETASTAYRGDRGAVAYNHAAAHGSAFGSGLYKITTNAQGHVTAATAVTKGDITALGIPAQDTNTWNAMKGATATAAGGAGYVAAPAKGQQGFFLRGDGAWAAISKSTVGLGNVDNTADSAKSVKYATSAGSASSATHASTADSATKATQDSAGNNINTTYVKNLSVSGRTITFTKGDGTTGTITTQDTNTTYNALTNDEIDAAFNAVFG